MAHIINILIGFLFLSTFFGLENYHISIIICIFIYIIINPGKFNFLKVFYKLVINIPKSLYETFILPILKKEVIESEKYTDDFQMLIKILTITLTPKTIVFDHDNNFLYIHKLDR
ncbi:hypothetical protein [Thermosipho sp. (in: thermotogales)]|jgi:multicomponent Na+:H+ antiporter subunit E|uniref:hypothetical protein n=1 Tax=Thermosipho sp. (in: thermotogales) TaxID=1968895 RepID=UPI00257A697E|nr:hypothetical protein [Thermosipho sp. (in: thermotogales)]MBZ4650027.1 hypothetical protein [Thermosipho sp. (in: thermotogales)]MDK2840282.1 multicomponent Na+:H+ antiporter subunit [Thermosipho sp. (in: thermotogales)]MDK2900246.1 multicomponent Na+:H+ antiporter subunit [Thermosipho sp. (in: thermotogales)]